MSVQSEDRKRIQAKLRRLMAMTVENGASEAEAMIAAETAARLMNENNMSYTNVDELDAESYADDTREWFRGYTREKRSAPVPVEASCLAAICKLCNVEHLFNSFYGTLTFFGAPSDTEVAHYLVVIIGRAIEREWQTYRASLPVGARSGKRASFRHAIAYRIAGRLDAMGKAHASPATGSGLVPVKNAIVVERFKTAHPDLKTMGEPKLTDMSAAAAGWHAGAKIPLSQGVNEATGAKLIGADTQ